MLLVCLFRLSIYIRIYHTTYNPPPSRPPLPPQNTCTPPSPPPPPTAHQIYLPTPPRPPAPRRAYNYHIYMIYIIYICVCVFWCVHDTTTHTPKPIHICTYLHRQGRQHDAEPVQERAQAFPRPAARLEPPPLPPAPRRQVRDHLLLQGLDPGGGGVVRVRGWGGDGSYMLYLYTYTHTHTRARPYPFTYVHTPIHPYK